MGILSINPNTKDMKITIVNRTKEEKTYTRVELDEFVNQLKDGTYHHHYIYSSQLLTPLSEEEPTFESCCKASYDPQEIPGVSLRTSRMMGLPQTYAARLATFIPLLTYKTEAYMKEHYTLRLNVMTAHPNTSAMPWATDSSH